MMIRKEGKWGYKLLYESNENWEFLMQDVL